MFEGNTISLKDNNVTLLSNENQLSCGKQHHFFENSLAFENASHSFEGNASLTKKKIVSVVLYDYVWK